jgi:hypothetical protein
MKPVKLAVGVMLPVMFLNGSREHHTDARAFVPEPEPTVPFNLISTATTTVLPGSTLFPLLWELEGPQFRVIK